MNFSELQVGDLFTFDPKDNRPLTRWLDQVWVKTQIGHWYPTSDFPIYYRAERVEPLGDPWDKIWVNSDYSVLPIA
jgi:hypothetical protein